MFGCYKVTNYEIKGIKLCLKNQQVQRMKGNKGKENMWLGKKEGKKSLR